jgi:DNA-binding MarR family transcriptional regulator
MLSVFQSLKALSEFERLHLPFLKTLQDRDLVAEIGICQALGQPLTVKQILLLGLGSMPTVLRRLRRLRRLGVIQQHRFDGDRRSLEVTLTPKALKALAGYGERLSKPSVATGRRASA